jgi:hypothetical protein
MFTSEWVVIFPTFILPSNMLFAQFTMNCLYRGSRQKLGVNETHLLRATEMCTLLLYCILKLGLIDITGL